MKPACFLLTIRWFFLYTTGKTSRLQSLEKLYHMEHAKSRKVRIDERLSGDKALDGQADAGLLRSNLALQANGKEIDVAGAS
jgi:hypothetical protein